MKLTQLINSTLDNYRVYSNLKDFDFEVAGIACNSKGVEDNFIFVAIKGVREDGHAFIEEAIGKGAKAVVVQNAALELNNSDKISVIRVKDSRAALAKLAAQFYGNPSAKMKVIGITGTNGKTTISYIIEAMLKEAGFNPGVIGTVNCRFKDRVVPSKNTTPGPLEIQSFLADMVGAGVNYAVMEVSSHAMDQERTEGVNFRAAIFTNLTQDHLDYHKTLENYFQAKAKLFKKISPGGFAVTNNDDAYGRRLVAMSGSEVITYGIENASSVMASDVKFDSTHTEFILKTDKAEERFKTSLIGIYNVYNILASCAWGLKEGLDLEVLRSAVEKFSFVPGRLERIDFPGDFQVFVDYAHTEDALRNVITTLRKIPHRRIIVVFGCGGERDKTKRPKMGRVVTELADYAVITSDNPRSEDPEEIIEDIKRGIKNKDNYCAVADRREAIKKSLSLAGPQDIVLLAGKGHETYQVLKDKMLHFDDREVARECLKSMSY